MNLRWSQDLTLCIFLFLEFHFCINMFFYRWDGCLFSSVRSVDKYRDLLDKFSTEFVHFWRFPRISKYSGISTKSGCFNVFKRSQESVDNADTVNNVETVDNVHTVDNVETVEMLPMLTILTMLTTLTMLTMLTLLPMLTMYDNAMSNTVEAIWNNSRL